MTIQTLKAELSSAKDPTQKSSCDVSIVTWDRKDRLKRAAITWIGCWVGAFIAIFLPGLHFVLVPTLLLAGPIGSSLVFSQTEWVNGGVGACPLCKAAFTVARGRVKWPLKDLCSKCGEEIEIGIN